MKNYLIYIYTYLRLFLRHFFLKHLVTGGCNRTDCVARKRRRREELRSTRSTLHICICAPRVCIFMATIRITIRISVNESERVREGRDERSTRARTASKAESERERGETRGFEPPTKADFRER